MLNLRKSDLAWFAAVGAVSALAQEPGLFLGFAVVDSMLAGPRYLGQERER